MSDLRGVIAVRVAALCDRHGATTAEVSEALGRHRDWLARKIAGKRSIQLQDLQAIVDHLGEPYEALMQPVLLPGDLEVLKFCVIARQVSELDRVFRNAVAAVRRLEGQLLVIVTRPDDSTEITEEAAVLTTAVGSQLPQHTHTQRG